LKLLLALLIVWLFITIHVGIETARVREEQYNRRILLVYLYSLSGCVEGRDFQYCREFAFKQKDRYVERNHNRR
jgi:hypothetical protein